MGIKSVCLISKVNSSLQLIFAMTVFCTISYAQGYNPISETPQNSGWKYTDTMGDNDLNKPAVYTPLKKIGRDVYTSLIPPKTSSIPKSPLGKDYYTYILPQMIFGKIQNLELKFSKSYPKMENIKAAELVQKIESALPIIIRAVRQKKEYTGEQNYLIRFKAGQKQKKASSSAEKSKSEAEKKEVAKTKSKVPSEKEIDVLVRFIFGQGKVIIKIPPLKNPKEKEELMKQLEKIAQILVREGQLPNLQEKIE